MTNKKIADGSDDDISLHSPSSLITNQAIASFTMGAQHKPPLHPYWDKLESNKNVGEEIVVIIQRIPEISETDSKKCAEKSDGVVDQITIDHCQTNDSVGNCNFPSYPSEQMSDSTRANCELHYTSVSLGGSPQSSISLDGAPPAEALIAPNSNSTNEDIRSAANDRLSAVFLNPSSSGHEPHHEEAIELPPVSQCSDATCSSPSAAAPEMLVDTCSSPSAAAPEMLVDTCSSPPAAASEMLVDTCSSPSAAAPVMPSTVTQLTTLKDIIPNSTNKDIPPSEIADIAECYSSCSCSSASNSSSSNNSNGSSNSSSSETSPVYNNINKNAANNNSISMNNNNNNNNTNTSNSVGQCVSVGFPADQRRVRTLAATSIVT